MRKRVARALIFLVVAIAAGLGVASTAGAFDGGIDSQTVQTDDARWE